MLDLLIISGASKGIGRSILNDLVPISKTIIGIGSSSKIEEIINIKHKNCKIIPIRLDLTNYYNVYDEIKATISKLTYIPTNIGIVCCGASIGEPGGLFEADFDEWSNLYRSNVLGNLAIIKGCEDQIKSGIQTNIVMFAGGGAAYGHPEFSGYALSKVSVVRAVENIGIEFEKNKCKASIIALSPGFIETDIGKKVLANGGIIKTKTDISEPTNFVRKFLIDELDTQKLNGRFLHVRDNIKEIDFNNDDICKLRRIE